MKLDRTNMDVFITSRNNYLMARTINETNIKINKESVEEVLSEGDYRAKQNYLKEAEANSIISGEYNKRVVKASETYYLNDEDFTTVQKKVLPLNEAKGLILPYDKYEHSISEPWNLSCDCESRPLLHLAEKAFIKASLEILPQEIKKQLQKITEIQNYSLQKKFIEINLQLDTGKEPTAKEMMKNYTEV